jgi:hypothetical protein
MSGRSVTRSMVLIAWAGAACAGHTAPAGFLPDADAAGRHLFGGWVDVTFGDAAVRRSAKGELIAVGRDSLWVLTDGGVVPIPTGEVVEGQLAGYQADGLGGAVALGVLSTASNGWFLVLTAPMWLIGGGIAANSQSKQGLEDLPAMEWADLARFARFPQGVPESVDLSSLRPVRR